MFIKPLVIAAAALASLANAVPVDRSNSSRVIEGSYIIQLKDDVSILSHLKWVAELLSRSVVKLDSTGIKREYNGLAFRGYAGRFDKETIAKISKSADVAYVEADQVWDVDDALTKRDITTQSPAPWGLGAISHRQPGSSDYVYDDAAGEGTFGYIVDTGIRTTHVEFEDRASSGWTGFPGDERDTNGHGTHVAGTVGGSTFGVAKKASLISVKVFRGGSGSTSTILAGFDWAVKDIVNNGRKNKAVINLSLGGPSSRAWNDAISKAYSQGVLSVVAAGNDQVDASSVSPASAPNAFTVGAVNENWEIVTDWPEGQGSNYGKVLEIFAPGDAIESADYRSDSGVAVKSGTSMACPHVAGLALYAMSVNGIRGAKAVSNHLVRNSGKGVVNGPLRGSPNRMANLGV